MLKFLKVVGIIVLVLIGAVLVVKFIQEKGHPPVEPPKPKPDPRKDELAKLRAQVNVLERCEAILNGAAKHYCLLFGIRRACASDEELLSRLYADFAALGKPNGFDENGFTLPNADIQRELRAVEAMAVETLDAEIDNYTKKLKNHPEREAAQRALEASRAALYAIVKSAKARSAQAQELRKQIDELRASLERERIFPKFSDELDFDPGLTVYFNEVPYGKIATPELFYIPKGGSAEHIGY